jgi:hypothetical protein
VNGTPVDAVLSHGISRLAFSDFETIVAEVVLASQHRYSCSASWVCSIPLETFPATGSGWTSIAGEIDEDPLVSSAVTVARDNLGHLLVVRREFERLTCRTYAHTADDARSLLDAVRLLLPVSATVDGTVPVTFWSTNGQHVHRLSRRIVVPSWAAVRDNYTVQTRRQLEALIARKPIDSGGKLILWHGAPGSGKTWALRALLSEWGSCFSGQYILDPERFFGEPATYMMSVLMDHDEETGDDSGQSDRWRLLMVEDVGELLGSDARLQTGQGLARLLNLCDGLVGQGLRVLVLLTTNEELGHLHPAVVRRGRCIANVRFDRLSAKESAAWTDSHGVHVDFDKPVVLADLFAADQIVTSHRASTTGFRPGRHVQ